MSKQVITNVNEAVSVLIQGVQIAQKFGCYDLEEARLIADAVDFFVVKKEEEKENKVEQ